MSEKIASEISSIENVNSLDDETIKALSLVIKSQASSVETYPTKEFDSPDPRILKLVKQVESESIPKRQKLTYEKTIEKSWSKSIKKHEILKFLALQGISLSSISSAKPIYDESGNLSSIEIGGKKINYSDIKEYFKLPSNKITNIENKLSEIIITGEGYISEDVFNISHADSLAKKGMNYREILSETIGIF